MDREGFLCNSGPNTFVMYFSLKLMVYVIKTLVFTIAVTLLAQTKNIKIFWMVNLFTWYKILKEPKGAHRQDSMHLTQLLTLSEETQYCNFSFYKRRIWFIRIIVYINSCACVHTHTFFISFVYVKASIQYMWFCTIFI